MTKTMTLMATMLVLCLFVGTEALAQKGMMWKGGGGWGAGTPYAGMYNPNTLETIAGEVISVEQFTLGNKMSSGVHIVLKADAETISAHLGPVWYMENQDVKIEANDKVEIKGSRITFEGHPAIIAKEVKKGDEVLMLRDESGFAVWSGWRRR